MSLAEEESDGEEVILGSKVVFVGDGGVGKTSLLMAFLNNVFPYDIVPSLQENFTVHHQQEDQKIFLQCFDIAGEEEYTILRPLSYVGSEIVVMCYSCVNSNSLYAIEENWYHEIHHYLPNGELIIVATKCDLLDSPRESSIGEIVDKAQGKAMAEHLGVRFFECSALTGQGVREVFSNIFERVYHLKFPYHTAQVQSALEIETKNKITERKGKVEEKGEKQNRHVRAKTETTKKKTCCVA